jgi:hypothetical protein
MMQIFSDLQPFETVVLYPEKYPNWFKLFSEHCKVFINMSDDDYELEKLRNPILEEFIKLNTGREPVPLKYHFDSVYADSATVVSTPRSVYFLDISKNEADKMQQDFGILIQCTDSIDDGVLRNIYNRNLSINKPCSENGKIGWQCLLANQLPPLNTIVISDNFLFSNEDGIRGFKNVVQLIQAVMPDTLNTDFNILLIAQEPKNKDAAWCNKVSSDIKTAIDNLKKPYNTIFEIVFAETIHPRLVISNYFMIKLEKGFAVFNSRDLQTVHETTDVEIKRMFHILNKHEGDPEYLQAESKLSEIKQICRSVAEYILNRPNDKNYRILGDCNPDKSLKNRLINDV